MIRGWFLRRALPKPAHLHSGIRSGRSIHEQSKRSYTTSSVSSTPSQETKLPSKKFPVPPDTSDGILHYLTDYIEYIKDLDPVEKSRMARSFPNYSWKFLNEMLEKTPSKALEAGEMLTAILPDLPGTRTTLQLARAIYSCLKYSWTIEKWPLILQIVSASQQGELKESLRYLQLHRVGVMLCRNNNLKGAIQEFENLLPLISKSSPHDTSFHMIHLLQFFRVREHQLAVYGLMVKHNVKITQLVFLALLQTATTLQMGLNIEQEMKQKLPLTDTVLDEIPVILLRLASKQGKREEADRIFNEYESKVQKGGAFPSKASQNLQRLYTQLFSDSLHSRLLQAYRQKQHDSFLLLFAEWQRDQRDSTDLEKRKILNMALMVASKKKMKDLGYSIYRELSSICKTLDRPSLAIATDFLAFNNMIEDLIDLWQRTLAAGVFPESNCWSSFIEALARHRLYESAYHIVGSYLAECQTVLKSASADSTWRALPDVKFAVVFVKLIGDPSIGDAETYKLRPLIPSYLFPRLKKSDDFAEQIRKLTPLEFEEFLGAFQLFKQNFENVKTDLEIRQSATDKILDSVKKNPKRIIPTDRNHKK